MSLKWYKQTNIRTNEFLNLKRNFDYATAGDTTHTIMDQVYIFSLSGTHIKCGFPWWYWSCKSFQPTAQKHTNLPPSTSRKKCSLRFRSSSNIGVTRLKRIKFLRMTVIISQCIVFLTVGTRSLVPRPLLVWKAWCCWFQAFFSTRVFFSPIYLTKVLDSCWQTTGK